MSSRQLSDLVPKAEENANRIIALCKERGVDLLVYCTLRTLEEQAQLFRRGRTKAQIDAKLTSLRRQGYTELADIIVQVGPQPGGPIVTYAAPGESWHNFGEAFDAVPLVTGKAVWTNGPQYRIYGEAVRSVGMNWAGDWQGFSELPHAQLRTGSNPLAALGPDAVRSLLKAGGLL
jgi:peptidoglycan L-alanyl-D-glutamate endopeptidase CwlK